MRTAEGPSKSHAVYRFAWDAADRLIAEQGFDARRRDYGYNRAGELVHLVDGVPQGAALLAPGVPGLLRTRFQRDERGRLTDKLSAKQGADGAMKVCHARHRYDLAGKMIRRATSTPGWTCTTRWAAGSRGTSCAREADVPRRRCTVTTPWVTVWRPRCQTGACCATTSTAAATSTVLREGG